MKKRIFSMIVSAGLAVSMLAACAPAATPTKPAETETTPSSQAAETTAPAAEQPGAIKGLNGTSVILGTTTEPTGDFATPWWQNNATDKAINDFINGLGTVEQKMDGEFLISKTVVKSHEVKVNDDKSKTYTFEIVDGLKDSNGREITAKDYVASILLFSSPVLKELNAKPTHGNFFLGYNEYLDKTSKEFKGVRLLDKMKFSVTLAPEYVPSFFELANVGIGPIDLDFWCNNEKAGKVEVKDDGNGAYLSENFTAANFGDSINKAKNEPKRPATGPYMVKEWDPAAKIMILEINPAFPGNFEGQKPTIQYVVYKKITSDTAMDELKTGGVDVLTSMMSGKEINAGMELVEDGSKKFEYFSYPRAGYGKLAFTCDTYPTQDVEVRQAIAHLLDRNKFTQAFTGGFGTVVNGPYGEGQWFFKESQAALTSKMDSYAYDVEMAKKILDGAGWNLNEKGEAYGGTGLRYKKNPDTGELMPLIIKWASSENNTVSELLVTQLQKSPDVTAAGMKIEQTVMTFEELLNYVYRDASKGEKYGTKTFNMFNFASNFPASYVPQNDYTTDPDKLKEGYNTNFIIDKDLEKFAENYWKVDPTEKDKFLTGWQEYIVRWNQLLPDLPLYSNEIHDFYNSKIKNYQATAVSNMVDTILYATVEK